MVVLIPGPAFAASSHFSSCPPRLVVASPLASSVLLPASASSPAVARLATHTCAPPSCRAPAVPPLCASRSPLASSYLAPRTAHAPAYPCGAACAPPRRMSVPALVAVASADRCCRMCAPHQVMAVLPYPVNLFPHVGVKHCFDPGCDISPAEGHKVFTFNHAQLVHQRGDVRVHHEEFSGGRNFKHFVIHDRMRVQRARRVDA